MAEPQPDMFEELPAGDGLAARRTALLILEQILGRKKMLDDVLSGDEAFNALAQRDRAFVRMLVATVLRRRGQLDDLISRALAKGEAPRPENLKWILYLGTTQILFMDVADHAAVDTSVTLTAENGMEGKKGFVNAVLRRMVSEGNKWGEDQDAAALNFPAWLYEQWMNGYGFVRAKEIALASLEEASLDFTVKDPYAKGDWAKKLAARFIPTGSLRRPAGGNITNLEGFSEGAWWVQDASAALPVRLFGDVEGKTVLDLCAAPGGKTAQLAASGAHVIALDRSASRMKSVTENLARLGLEDKAELIIEDGAVWKPKQKFTHILLDAPCTATGTIRRHPDLLALKNEKDQAGLVSIQERLLKNAAAMLEDGGMLIYCTCSLQKAEGEQQIEKFLKENPTFKRIPVRSEEIGGLETIINSEGDVRILPYHLKEEGGMDGFFISRLQKSAA